MLLAEIQLYRLRKFAADPISYEGRIVTVDDAVHGHISFASNPPTLDLERETSQSQSRASLTCSQEIEQMTVGSAYCARNSQPSTVKIR